jgi:hypothetical protein
LILMKMMWCMLDKWCHVCWSLILSCVDFFMFKPVQMWKWNYIWIIYSTEYIVLLSHLYSFAALFFSRENLTTQSKKISNKIAHTKSLSHEPDTNGRCKAQLPH